MGLSYEENIFCFVRMRPSLMYKNDINQDESCMYFIVCSPQEGFII